MSSADSIVRGFFECYGAGDLDAVHRVLSEDVTAYVTNARGGVDKVVGRDAYADRLPRLDDAQLALEITQSVEVAPSQVLTMVKIDAERRGKSLKNFAAFLTRVSDSRIVEIWMVEALPSYSDEFWS